jgi:hypothetical protein
MDNHGGEARSTPHPFLSQAVFLHRVHSSLFTEVTMSNQKDGVEMHRQRMLEARI